MRIFLFLFSIIYMLPCLFRFHRVYWYCLSMDGTRRACKTCGRCAQRSYDDFEVGP